MLKSAIKNGAVGLKNSMAYGRSIYYENVQVEIVASLFKQSPALKSEDIKALQDFLFHWILTKAAEYNLPVQIHTGYLAGNGNQLDNGEPTKLNNLFQLHPKTRFDLFHGGFPWTGEFVALGKMFPNVYLNLVWLPQISKNRAIVTFNEMLDCVPYNKILWGGDCQLIEETVGVTGTRVLVLPRGYQSSSPSTVGAIFALAVSPILNSRPSHPLVILH